MATPLRRSRKEFSFTNSLPKTVDVRGKENVSEDAKFFRQELERLYKFMQEQMQSDFEQLDKKINDLHP